MGVASGCGEQEVGVAKIMRPEEQNFWFYHPKNLFKPVSDQSMYFVFSSSLHFAFGRVSRVAALWCGCSVTLFRGTGITTMFQAGLPEKVIQYHSGHRSIDGLRKYERISDDQQVSARKVLGGSAAAETSVSKPVSVQNNMQHQMFFPVYRQQQPSCSLVQS